MYCKNCGGEMGKNDGVCKECGATNGAGSAYCRKCGKETPPGSSFCPHCNSPILNRAAENEEANSKPKSRKTAGLLGIFLGFSGAHNFYLGNIGVAAAQLLITIGTCGIGGIVTEIWGIIEGVRILTGAITTDGKGFPLKD